VDPRKLAKKPSVVQTKIGPVTVPTDEPTSALEIPSESASESVREVTAHTEIQWRLLNLGSDLGLDVWVARNDRSREFDGQSFGAMPRLRNALPNQFDEATNRTVELIDVLWLRGNAFVAAFEIESTTSIYFWPTANVGPVGYAAKPHHSALSGCARRASVQGAFRG
jgi:hypothetical protein